MGSAVLRPPLLNPDLLWVGFGWAETTESPGAWFVLDAARGQGRRRIRFYPVDGQQEVPLVFAGHELPDPIPQSKGERAGYPITVTFPERARVKNVKATLRDDASQEVAVWFSSPDRPVLPEHQGTTVCLIAKRPLRPKTTYTVRMAA